jgi:YD repeat-containing protein
MTTTYVVVVCGRAKAYAFGPFPTEQQAGEYADTWLAQASYQVVPMEAMRVTIIIATIAWASMAHAEQRTIYDARGNVVGRTVTDSQRTTTFYDANGRVVAKGNKEQEMTVQRAVIIYPDSKAPWKGKIIQAGVEQSEVEVTEGPENMVGKVFTLPNGDLKYDRKSAGPDAAQDYDPGRAGPKTREKPMDDEAEGATKDQYNSLVAQAQEIGLDGYKPISTRFRDAATGAKRCEALAEAIEAHKAKTASGEVTQPKAVATEPPPTKNKEKSMAKAKKKGKATAPAKKVAAKKANGAAEKRDGICGEFGTREGSYKEKLLLALYAKRNKPVPIGDAAKAVYGNGSADSKSKVKAIVVGINMSIEGGKLPYKPVEFEGRGDDATLMLASKSGR